MSTVKAQSMFYKSMLFSFHNIPHKRALLLTSTEVELAKSHCLRSMPSLNLDNFFPNHLKPSNSHDHFLQH